MVRLSRTLTTGALDDRDRAEESRRALGAPGAGAARGDGGLGWGECAYLPEELDVYCEQCRFNYFSLEGNPTCDDPLTCEHAPVPLSHVENYRRWADARSIPVGAQ